MKYKAYVGKNSYNGHGGRDLDDGHLIKGDSRACMARCDADTRCDCVVWEPARRACYKRSHCQPSRFQSSRIYTTYVRVKNSGLRPESSWKKIPAAFLKPEEIKKRINLQIKFIWKAYDKAEHFWHGRQAHADSIIMAGFKPEADILSAMVI